MGISYSPTFYCIFIQKNPLICYFNLGSFTYEKYFAGKYIGELSRLALQKLHDEYLFLPRCEKISFQRDSVSSSDVSDLVTGDKKMIGDFIQNKLLQENPLPDDDDLAVVEYVFKLLSERCALLVNNFLFVKINTFYLIEILQFWIHRCDS